MKLRTCHLLFMMVNALVIPAAFAGEVEDPGKQAPAPNQPPPSQSICTHGETDGSCVQPVEKTGHMESSPGGAAFLPSVGPASPDDKQRPPSKDNTKPDPCHGGNLTSGYPVILATGEKIKDQTDFVGAGLYPLSLSRTYRGFGAQNALMFGKNWTSSFDYHLYTSGCRKFADYPGACIPSTVELDMPDGKYVYTSGGNPLTFQVAGSDAMGTIYYDGPGNPLSIKLDGYSYVFDGIGRISSIADRSGANALVFQYSGTTNQLVSVTNPGNQVIRFTWTGTHVTQVTDPRGQIWTYGYDANGMLKTVTSPDSHTTTYGYDPTNTTRLTGITVDSTQVLAVTYYANGQVASSGTPDGEVLDKFTYGSNSTTLTNQLGDLTVYGFQSVQGGLKIASISHAGTTSCPSMGASTVYDANGWVDYTLDWRGIKTDYTYLPDGRLQDMTRAAGTAMPFKDVYTWQTVQTTGEYVVQSIASYDTGGNLIRTTTYGYTPTGIVNSISTKDEGTGAVASTTYAYTYASNNTLQSQTETRNLPTGAATTTYNYDGAGNLASVTDASGATVSYGGYDGLGRPATMIAANGVSHAFTYDGRGNLATDIASLVNGTAKSIYVFDGRSNLVSASYPDGSSTHNTIAQSGRVATQTDAAGFPANQSFANASTIVNSVDRAVASVSGNSISSSLSGKVSSTQKLDTLGRQITVLGNNGQTFTYGYDLNSNLTSFNDGLHTTKTAYDALNRPYLVTLPDNSTIAYGYAANGGLNSVATSRGAQTTFVPNNLGFVTQRTSPDTGVTTYTVDPFGRTTQEARANGTTVNYGYDGLDRLTSRTSNGNTESYSFASSGANAGQLTAISNPTSSSSYGYDGYGHVNSQTDIIFGQTFGTSYGYNAAGQLTSVSYPDGLSVGYGYNAAGQVTGVTPSRSGGVVSSAVYQPWGAAPYAFAYGNGSTMVGAVDTDGRLAGLTSIFSKSIAYNVDNTIAGINDATYPDLNETFSYDAQSRLRGTSRSSDPQSFGIDSDGNRTSTTRAGVTTPLPIANGSNKVTSWTYMGGDIYSDGVRTYTRDEFDRLAAVTQGGQTVGQYRYDALDRRVYKNSSQGSTYFVYAPSGQLLYEQSSQRTVDYVWLADRLVAVSINQGALQSVHTDWLGRPELITGPSTPTVAWRASNAAYDRKVTLDTIGGLNLFFPGQYSDAESGLYYNWHRYYDPATGRYVQSDPIGLQGGINTYAYVDGRPLDDLDFEGLAPEWFPPPGVTPAEQRAVDYQAGQIATGGAAMILAPAIARVAIPAAIALAKENASRFSFDGPSPGLQYGNGRICQVRFDKKPLVRLDYHPYPGTNGQSRLHLNIWSEGVHIPLDPRSFTDKP